MTAADLARVFADRRYCVLATTNADGHPRARPVGFVVCGTSFWVATVAGGRLTNVRRTPWASLVIEEGEHDDHRALIVDGPVDVVDTPPEDVIDAWEARLGSRGEWARAWLELRPERLLSHVARTRSN